MTLSEHMRFLVLKVPDGVSGMNKISNSDSIILYFIVKSYYDVPFTFFSLESSRPYLF
jgi:hypothetical protein